MDWRHEAGRAAERAARSLLERHGLTFIDANYRCRQGEIDLIMRDGAVLVFVEVRLRSESRFGSGADSVTQTKRRRIIATATHFLSKLHGPLPYCRFDVVSVSRPNYRSELNWIRDAFTHDG